MSSPEVRQFVEIIHRPLPIYCPTCGEEMALMYDNGKRYYWCTHCGCRVDLSREEE